MDESTLSGEELKRLGDQCRAEDKANVKDAVAYYRKAIDKKIPAASNSLGEIYVEQSKGKEHLLHKAVELFTDATKEGVAAAFSNLGNMYRSGLGVTKNLVEARILYEKAALQGVAEAMNRLGNMHRDGEGGLSRNVEKAAELYHQAADKGFQDAKNNLISLFRSEPQNMHVVFHAAKAVGKPPMLEALGKIEVERGSELRATAKEWESTAGSKEHQKVGLFAVPKSNDKKMHPVGLETRMRANRK